MRKIRILFMPLVDADNVNAQSLNTRDIVLRLDAARFECTLFYQRRPDPRLLNRANIKLLRLPARLKTPYLLKEMAAGHNIIAYTDYSPASYLYLHLPRFLRRHTKAVLHVEAPIAALADNTKMLRFLHRGVVRNCDIYTAITQWISRDCASYLPLPARYILPVGVDSGIFYPPLGIVDREPVVLVVGTLIERKRPLVVLDAAVRFPGIQFRVIGSGRNGYELEMAGRIEKLGLKNVVLEGMRSQDGIAEALRESDIFLLPSRIEGLPKVTLEAAASGLPCIVFRDYETPSVVDGITGFQVNTVEEMLEKLGILLTDRRLREAMGHAARKHAEQFSWDAISCKWEEAYLDIATSK